jgi:hypothetical protein
LSSLGEEGFFSNLLADCRGGAKEIETESRDFTALKAIQIAEVLIERYP